LKLRVGAWPSVYRPMPVLLAIDRFRLRFPNSPCLKSKNIWQ
jgi:hypothetical protein